MIIIFEGADGVGKTTLANLLGERLSMPVRHRIVRVGPHRVLQAHYKDIEENDNTILDRCYALSDMVYEIIATGHESVVLSHIDQIIHHINDRNIIVIFVECAEKCLVERLDRRGDPLYNTQQILEAQRRYKEMFAQHQPSRYLRVDTSQGTSREHVEMIMNYIHKNREGECTCK